LVAVFVIAASVPAFVLGIVAGRRWLAGSVGTTVLLVLGVPVLAWSAVLIAVRGGEGISELAIIGGLISTACSLLGALWTVLRRSLPRES
jgi:hypothetical protein